MAMRTARHNAQQPCPAAKHPSSPAIGLPVRRPCGGVGVRVALLWTDRFPCVCVCARAPDLQRFQARCVCDAAWEPTEWGSVQAMREVEAAGEEFSDQDAYPLDDPVVGTSH